MEMIANLKIEGGVPVLVIDHDKGRSVFKYDTGGSRFYQPCLKFADKASRGAWEDVLRDEIINQDLEGS